MKIVRRKKKDGTQIDASSRGVDGARVEISHPQWMNATTIGGNGKTGLILQNGTKLENDYKTKIKTMGDGRLILSSSAHVTGDLMGDFELIYGGKQNTLNLNTLGLARVFYKIISE